MDLVENFGRLKVFGNTVSNVYCYAMLVLWATRSSQIINVYREPYKDLNKDVGKPLLHMLEKFVCSAK